MLKKSQGLGGAVADVRRDLLVNLTLRDLRSQYNRSVLGWAWTVLNPLITIVVYSLVFSIFLRVSPPVGDPSGLNSYGFFLVSALLPWTFLAVGLTRASESITGNQSLVTKVFFPRWTLPGSIVLSGFITLLIEMAVLLILFMVVTSNNVLVWLPVLAVVVLLQLLFVLGLGVLVSILNVYFRDISHLIGVGLQPWFFLTPIIYPLSTPQLNGEVGGIGYRTLLRLNPMTHFAEAYRNVLYDLRWPTLTVWVAMVISVAVALGLAGWAYRRLEPRIAEEI